MKEKNVIKMFLLLCFYNQATKTMELEESSGSKDSIVSSAKIAGQNSKKPFIPTLALTKVVTANNNNLLQVPGSARDVPLLTSRGTNALFYKLDSHTINNNTEEIKTIKKIFEHNPEEIADLHPSEAFGAGGRLNTFLQTRWQSLYSAARSNKIDLWILKDNRQNETVGYFFMTSLGSGTLMIHPLTLFRYKDITAKPFFETYLKNHYGANLGKIVAFMHRLNGVSHFYSLSMLNFKNHKEDETEDETLPTLRDKISYILPDYMNDDYIIVEKELKG